MSARHEQRGIRGAVIAASVLTGAALAAGSAVIGASVSLARKAVTPTPHGEGEVVVHSIQQPVPDEPPIVRLTGPDTQLPGKYSLFFQGGAGHARLGAITRQSRDYVERELLEVTSGELRAGDVGWVNGWWFSQPEDLGLRVDRVKIPCEGGLAEAWIIHPSRPRKRRWAVHVHGRGALPAEALRGVRSCANLGITSLIISYRNDPGAPAGDFGRYGLGLSEARDIDAAVEYAATHGAERVTLFGWSMGGTASLMAANQGEQRNIIDGLVLDSPALDWIELLHYQAGLISMPTPVTRLGIWLLASGRVRSGEGAGLNIDALTPKSIAKQLRVPVLVHASSADSFVPCHGAEAFAAVKPELVQLRLVQNAEHVKLWNVDPESWEASTEQFLRWLPRPAWRG